MFSRFLNPKSQDMKSDTSSPSCDEPSDFTRVFPISSIAQRLGLVMAAFVILLMADRMYAEEKVPDSSPERKIEFTRDVLPVLSKSGCNTGACHGALAGKGGFKLSLNAYDPIGDHFYITRQSRGRRIEIADPGRSLLLTKPTGMLPHKGGLKLDPDSENYQILAQWIAQGAPGPKPVDAKLESLSVSPKQISLQPGKTSQLKVMAKFSDGLERDVTKLCRFHSTLEPVLNVDEAGQVKVVGKGEGAVVVWYASQLAVATISAPFEHQLDPEIYDKSPARNFIDKLVLEKLQALNLRPAARCTDATFIRRAFLDTIGMLPSEQETRDFLADSGADKRDRLIERLLGREEFVDYWTYRWSDVFLISGKRLRPRAVKAYYQWLRGQIEKNAPWDSVVTEVVTARGSSYENGATNFYALHQTPEDMAENVSQAFLGLSINCAKCHNHPLEKWTNDQYYAMANLFSRVRSKGWGGDARNGDGLRTLFLVNSGELLQPLTGRPQPPTPLDGVALDFDDPKDRRVHLAKWLTADSNPYFSRSVVNRIWANFMGRGLVENVDDMRISNPASNEPLLAALSAFVVENKFDLKSLMRVILQSEAYQRQSKTDPENEADDRFYSHYYPRRLMAEVLLDAVSQVSEVPTEFSKIQLVGENLRNTKEYPLGTRAIELYDSAVASRFLSTFGRNQRDIVCECERSNKPSMVQVLHIANGDTINQKLGSKSSCVGKLFAPKEPKEKQKEKGAAKSEPPLSLDPLVESAYLRSLCRFPTETEKQSLLKELKAAQAISEQELRLALEDLYWGLMSSREFMFQH